MMSVREFSSKATFVYLTIIAFVVGIAIAGTDGIIQLPRLLLYNVFSGVMFDNEGLFWLLDWGYWIVAALAIAIATLVISLKESVLEGLWTFLAMLVAKITAITVAHLTSTLLMPTIMMWSPSTESTDMGMGLSVFALGPPMRAILLYSPHIIVGISLFAFIFICIRYSDKYGIVPYDILWSFLFCGIVAPIVAILVAMLAVLVAWIVVFALMMILTLLVVVVVIAYFCCCR